MHQALALALTTALLPALAGPASAQPSQPLRPLAGVTVMCPQEIRSTLDIPAGWQYAAPPVGTFTNASFRPGDPSGAQRGILCIYNGAPPLFRLLPPTCQLTGVGWSRASVYKPSSECAGRADSCAVTC